MEINTIKEVFQLPVKNESLFQQAFQLNGFAKPFLPVISNLDSHSIDFYRWQLIPTWVNEEKDFNPNTLNARAEGIFENSTYKPYWQRRCLIICTGFFEPHKVKGEEQSQSYYIKPKEAEYFTLRGILFRWKDLHTFSIITISKGVTSITYNYLNKREKITVQGKGMVTYVYDAAGNHLQKRVKDNNLPNTEIYDYIGNFVYKDNILQYILNDEGRCRPVANAQGETKFVYDYFIKDHLGNVRSTVTAEPISPQYLALHEIASANIEQLFFDNIPAVRDGKPGGTDPSDHMAAHLIAEDAERRIGTAIMLKAMPGDRFDISADGFYQGEYQGGETVNGSSLVGSLLSTMMGGQIYSGVPIAELPKNAQTIQQALGNPSLAGQLTNLLNGSDDPSKPRSHLNYLFFNSKFELVSGISGAIQIPMDGDWVPLEANNLVFTLDEPGYVFVYIDNQSIGKDTWFDNVHIEHYTSSVLEENHYYPFGLTITGEAGGNTTGQPYKYNGKELEKSFGLEMYDFHARVYDPQLGRTWQLDPMANIREWVSPYSWVQNNPISRIDPTGAVDDVFITGTESKEAFKQLKSSTNLKLKMEDNGKVTATGNAKTDADKKLLEATTNANVKVQVNASSSNFTDQDKWYIGGAYQGSTIGSDGKVYTKQTVNPKMTKTMDEFNGAKIGVSVLHEVLESYIGGVESPGIGAPTYEKATPEYKAYMNAHDKTDAIDTRRKESKISQDANTGKLYINRPHPQFPTLNEEKLINDLSK